LFTNTSMPPNRATVDSTHICASSGCPTWAAVQATRSSGTPAVTNPLAASAKSSAVRELSITLAPASAKRAAVARPMPRLAPVINAVLPVSASSIARALHGCRRAASWP